MKEGVQASNTRGRPFRENDDDVCIEEVSGSW